MKLYIVAIFLTYCIVLASGTFFDCGFGRFFPLGKSKNNNNQGTNVYVNDINKNKLKNDADQIALQSQKRE